FHDNSWTLYPDLQGTKPPTSLLFRQCYKSLHSNTSQHRWATTLTTLSASLTSAPQRSGGREGQTDGCGRSSPTKSTISKKWEGSIRIPLTALRRGRRRFRPRTRFEFVFEM